MTKPRKKVILRASFGPFSWRHWTKLTSGLCWAWEQCYFTLERTEEGVLMVRSLLSFYISLLLLSLFRWHFYNFYIGTCSSFSIAGKLSLMLNVYRRNTPSSKLSYTLEKNGRSLLAWFLLPLKPKI